MQPIFIPSESGPLFAMFYHLEGNPLSHAIIHIPAFAEEMNKTRRVVAQQAKQFAEQHQSVLVLDLFGTGDSAGEFHQATWAIWLDNIATAVEWLYQQGAKSIGLWGLRVGALLAMDFIHQSPHKIDSFLAWQAVVNGENFVDELLRLYVAAAMFDPSLPRYTITELKQRILNDNELEVGGYLFNPCLLKYLMNLRAEQLNLKTVKNIHFAEGTYL